MSSIEHIILQGHETAMFRASDEAGTFFCIIVTPDMPKDIMSNVDQIDGNIIREVNYVMIDGKRAIKAYY